ILDAPNNTIGGAVTIAPNVIAGNAIGVNISGSGAIGNRVERNSIFGNTALGIDLAPAGHNATDAGDPDTGSNQLQNAPNISSVSYNGSQVTIQYAVNSADIDASTTGACYPITVEFYVSDSLGQGKTYVGSHTYTTPQASTST